MKLPPRFLTLQRLLALLLIIGAIYLAWRHYYDGRAELNIEGVLEQTGALDVHGTVANVGGANLKELSLFYGLSVEIPHTGGETFPKFEWTPRLQVSNLVPGYLKEMMTSDPDTIWTSNLLKSGESAKAECVPPAKLQLLPGQRLRIHTILEFKAAGVFAWKHTRQGMFIGYADQPGKIYWQDYASDPFYLSH